MNLDIIIPVYNEGKNIVRVLESLAASVKTPFRIFVVFDNENDDTLKALDQSREFSFEIIRVKNTGRGAHPAVMTGFGCSTAPACVVFPADDTFNAGIIDKMVEKFEQGCQIVAASRFMKGGCMKGCPWLKTLLVRFSAFTLYHFAQVPTHDASSGFRLFSKKVLNEIKIESTRGFTYSIEFLVKCHRLGWKIGEVPALWFERVDGRSRFRVLQWLPAYLHWYCYAFATTFFGRRSV